MTECSIVEYFAEHEGYRCGYCKSPDSNYSHGMWAHQLTVNDYQDLIDRGWRRSGKYCYKPTMEIMCCPMYTIKCSVKDFKLSKSQKKVIKRMNKFLIHGKNEEMKETKAANLDGLASSDNGPSDFPEISVIQKASSKIEKAVHVEYDSSTNNISLKNTLKENSDVTEVAKDVIKISSEKTSELIGTKKQTSLKPSLGIDPSKPLCRKAKEIRMEKKLQKLSEKAQGDEVMQVSKPSKPEPIVKSLEDFLSEAEVPNTIHKLEFSAMLRKNRISNTYRPHLRNILSTGDQIKLVRSEPISIELQKTFPQTLEIYQKYQNIIHDDPLEKCTQKQFTGFLVSSPLQVKLVRPQSKDIVKTLSDEISVYQVYQMIIHQDDPSECTESGFTRFLVDSPLEEESSFKISHGYGSFHQQYWLDGKLIAVGVIDILPKCVSSVYLFYDPDYSFLSLGTYAALREIAFTRELVKLSPELQSYYMGFYIHSCPKMRYKGQYYPSALLCPETYTWCPYEEAKIKLDALNYCRLENDAEKGDEDGKIVLEDILILYRRKVRTYSQYRALTNGKDTEEIKQYASLVGRKCYSRMLLYRS